MEDVLPSRAVRGCFRKPWVKRRLRQLQRIPVGRESGGRGWDFSKRKRDWRRFPDEAAVQVGGCLVRGFAPLKLSPETGLVDRSDQLLHSDLVRIERHASLPIPEADIRPVHTLEPLQGSLDREGSSPSGHALDGQHDRRGGGQRSVRE